jgi:hypothetical protein
VKALGMRLKQEFNQEFKMQRQGGVLINAMRNKRKES